MTVRDTSVEKFYEIRDNGLLAKVETAVLGYIVKNGSVTIRETTTALIDKWPSTSTCGVFSRLKEQRVIEDWNKRKCRVTGNTVYEWRFTGRVPKKSLKPTKHKCSHCKGKGFITQERLL